MKKHMVERIQDLYVGIDNDLSARREHGKTPQGNELNGRWVLRDSEGNWIDHDQYRSDLFSRHGILEVETGHLLDTVSKYKARIAELEAELAAEPRATNAPTAVAAADPQLLKFYGAASDAELIAAQAAHIERLQAKLQPAHSFAPQRVREG